MLEFILCFLGIQTTDVLLRKNRRRFNKIGHAYCDWKDSIGTDRPSKLFRL